MRCLRRLRAKGQRGQALVEFAFVGLIFLGVIYGMIDVGRAVWNYNTLAQAAREGARYAVVHGARCEEDPSCTAADQAGVEAIVELHAAGLDATRLEVDPLEWTCRLASASGSCNDVWDHVTVTAHYDYAPMSFFTALLNLPSVTMTSTTTMEIHY